MKSKVELINKLTDYVFERVKNGKGVIWPSLVGLQLNITLNDSIKLLNSYSKTSKGGLTKILLCLCDECDSPLDISVDDVDSENTISCLHCHRENNPRSDNVALEYLANKAFFLGLRDNSRDGKEELGDAVESAPPQ